MTSSPTSGASVTPVLNGPDLPDAPAQTKITVADPKQMVSLLGARDQILRLIERSVVSDIHVRGNEITITGKPAENALAERVFTELIELIQKGETLTEDGLHIQLLDLQQPLQIGRTFPLRLVFEAAGTVEAALNVDYAGLR